LARIHKLNEQKELEMMN